MGLTTVGNTGFGIYESPTGTPAARLTVAAGGDTTIAATLSVGNGGSPALAWGGWNQSLRLTQTGQAAVVNGNMLFGLHDTNNAFYWANTDPNGDGNNADGAYMLSLTGTGNLAATGTSISLTNSNTLFFGDGTNTASRASGSYYVQSVGGASTHAILGSTQYFNGRISIQGNGAACSQPANGTAGFWLADAGDCSTVFVGISSATNGGELIGIWTGGWDWQTDTGGSTYQSGNIFYNGNIWNDAQTTVATNNGTVCWDPGQPFGGGVDTHDQYARCSSIRALKTNIVDLPYGLSAIRQLQPRQFDWISSGLQDFGFIADEVEAIHPMFAEYDGNGTLTGVHYLHMSALMAQGIKELDVQVQSIDARLTVLESGQFAGNLTVQGDTTVQKLTVNGKIITGGAVPTVAVGLVSGAASAVTVVGNDTAGKVSYTTGIIALPTNPVLAGAQFSATFSEAYAQAPRIAITPKNQKAASVRYFVETTEVGFTVHFIDTPDVNTQYEYDYIVIQ